MIIITGVMAETNCCCDFVRIFFYVVYVVIWQQFDWEVFRCLLVWYDGCFVTNLACSVRAITILPIFIIPKQI